MLRLCSIFLLTNLVFSANFAFGQSTEQVFVSEKELIHNLKYLGQLSRYTAVDGANSYGSMGATIGLGMSDHSHNAKDRFLTDDSQGTDQSKMRLPKFWMIKGLSVPINFGFIGGYDSNTGIYYAGGHIQWSVFEHFQLPSIAIRGDHSEVFGVQETKIQQSSLKLVSSYGFLRYFEIFGSIGQTQNSVSTKINKIQNNTPIYSFIQNEADQEFRFESQGRAQGYGLKVVVLPPFLAMSAEVQSDQLGNETFTARMQLGL